MKKNAAIALISFAVLKWHECLSFQLPFELTVELPVQSHLELEVNLLVCNVIEREIKREKVQMKPPQGDFKGVSDGSQNSYISAENKPFLAGQEAGWNFEKVFDIHHFEQYVMR